MSANTIIKESSHFNSGLFINVLYDKCFLRSFLEPLFRILPLRLLQNLRLPFRALEKFFPSN